jgi:hypothetical protein
VVDFANLVPLLATMNFSRVVHFCVLCLPLQYARSQETELVKFPTNEWIQRADLHTLKTVKEPSAWLLLCPGRNGNGENLMHDTGWRKFADEHRLWIAAISFASNRKEDLLGRYTLVDQGTGDWVVSHCDSLAPQKLPFFVVGFSAGARFTTNFVGWKPERVLAWSAQAVGNWPEPKASTVNPPGVVASGEYDAGSWFASLQYFQGSRKLGKPVIWLSLEKLHHARSPALDDYTGSLFTLYMPGSKKLDAPLWRDIDTKKPLTPREVESDPIFASWFPNKILANRWHILHYP